tara:strand:+ start:2877 stop:5057 length:2181 start_codon:yes stop_codon:yes gene_type:complete
MLLPKNKFIIGTANFGRNYGYGKNLNNLSVKKVDKILKFCKENNIDSLDTAVDYGVSEKIIGKISSKFNITTKIEFLNGGKKEIKNKIISDVGKSLDTLKVKTLDCLMLHDPLQLLSKDGKFIMKNLNILKKKGIIKKIGISVYEVSELEKIVDNFKIDIVQFPCNYLNREFLKITLLKKLKKKNIEIHVRSIFLQGKLLQNPKKLDYFKKWSTTFDDIDVWHKKNKISKLESCLGFIFNNKFIDKVIIGVDSLEELKQIVKIKKLKKVKSYFPESNDRELIDSRLWKEGKLIDKNQLLWDRAKKTILGGNMLFSKRPDLFVPNKWPTYFSRAKGCKIWDITGKKFTDFSLMSVGTNILGYGSSKVDNAVSKAIKNGNLSTLNCPEEVELAEKLTEIHPWSDQVKFARSGGEASAISIRIARAAAGRDNVAFCGYHGWHDWYLSANLGNNQNLNNHLLPGLNSKGVSKNLRNTVYPFNYNDFKSLEKLIDEKKIGTVKMEVSRNQMPQNNFLKKIRDICTKNGIVLIFDECSSGFRQTFGGLHKLYNVNPDIATFGKALGNGYPITAIIGKKEVMDAAKESFISSTFWGDRIGPVAALATLKEMQKIKSWKTITKKGEYLRKEWVKIAKKHELNLSIAGIPSSSSFIINSNKFLEYKTFISQEFLKKNFLVSNIVQFSVVHKQKIIDEYLYHLDGLFKIISECERGRNIYKLLEQPVCTSGFKRLN